MKILRGKENKTENINIYDTQGNKLDENEEKDEIENVWKEIYQRGENKMKDVWNEESEKVYIENTDNKIKLFKNSLLVT